MPKSKLGWWSFGLIIAVPILFFLATTSIDVFYEDIPSGDTILLDIIGRPVLAIGMLSGMLSGISAFFTGIIAIFKKNDYGILVLISTILGLCMLLYVSAVFWGEFFM